MAGMVHALTLLAVLLFAAPLAQYIPLAVLAAILMVVSYNMGEWREIPKILKMSWADISVWLVTFALTVFVDLTLAVEFGMVLAALLFISKGVADHERIEGHKEYISEGLSPHLAGQAHSRICHRGPYSRPLPVRDDGATCGHYRPHPESFAYRNPAAAKYDGD